jgi:hypothetical protein
MHSPIEIAHYEFAHRFRKIGPAKVNSSVQNLNRRIFWLRPAMKGSSALEDAGSKIESRRRHDEHRNQDPIGEKTMEKIRT